MPSRSKDQPITPWGAFVMFWILLAVIVCAGIPMAAGVIITAFIPWFGELREFNPWLLLHILWIYPVFWFVALLAEGVFKHIFGTGPGRKVGEALEDITCCLAVALMYYTVFFRDPLGAIFASLVSFLLMKPFVDWLERHTPPDEPEDSPEPESAGPDDSDAR